MNTVRITIADLNALGESFNEIKDKTFGKQTTKVYLALAPFYELLDQYRKGQQAYIKEHTPEGWQGIPRYESAADEEGNELSMEEKRRRGVPETEEFTELQRFMDSQVYEVHEFKTTPVLEEAQANKLTPNQIRVFDMLGLLVKPKASDSEPDDAEEDQE